MIALLKRQWFVLGLLVAVLFSFQFPQWGASGGPLHTDITTNIAIMLVFLIQGWMLPTEVLAKCMVRVKVHLFTQAFIFLVFPLVILFGDLFWSSWMSNPLRYGFFFLAVVPTTITSAIIYTSQAEGSIPIALVNTTLSNVAGIIITPLWMLILASAGTGEMGDLGAVVMKLSKLILAPLLVGQIGHIFWEGLIQKFKVGVGYFNQLVIVFIVFAVFSNSVAGGAWEGQGHKIVLIALGICVGIFAIMNVLCIALVRFLKIPKDEQAAILFCGTQKTLAAGVPLGISLFGNDPSFGIILLPVMLYHPVQLILGAFLIEPLRARSTH